MNPSRDRILFWCLIAAQAAGSQVIIWSGVPTYQRLHAGGKVGASAREFTLALAVVVVMQVAHWLSLPLKPHLRFRRNVLLGHLLMCIGELSLFFTAALATVILFDRFGELEFTLWKALILAAMLFAVSSYKYQLMSLGESMIETEPDKPTDD